jgi:hypothetical protein
LQSLLLGSTGPVTRGGRFPTPQRSIDNCRHGVGAGSRRARLAPSPPGHSAALACWYLPHPDVFPSQLRRVGASTWFEGGHKAAPLRRLTRGRHAIRPQHGNGVRADCVGGWQRFRGRRPEGLHYILARYVMAAGCASGTSKAAGLASKASRQPGPQKRTSPSSRGSSYTYLPMPPATSMEAPVM